MSRFGGINRRRSDEPNRPWLSYFGEVKKTGKSWITVTELIADDKSFDDDKSAQLSYSQSWLLVHYLMKEPRLAEFRSYSGGHSRAVDCQTTGRIRGKAPGIAQSARARPRSRAQAAVAIESGQLKNGL